MENPFFCDGPLKPGKKPTMIWRESLLELLLEDIKQAYHPLIIGPSQSGKTTLAYQLINRLQMQNTNIVITIETGSLADATEANVIDLFFKSTKLCLETELQRVNLDQLINEINKIYNGKQPSTCYEFSEFLDAIYTILNNIYRIILVIDEIEVLPEQLLYNILCLFRSLATKNLNRNKNPFFSIVILCQQDLSTFDKGKGSPYNINAKTRRITDFTFNEFSKILDHEHTKITDKIFSEEAISFIYKETNGHPYLVQRICQLAVEIMNEEKYEKIDEETAIKALIILFEKGNRHLRIIYDSVPQNDEQKEIILNILKKIPIPFKRISPAYRYLEDKGVIIEDKVHKTCIFHTNIHEKLFLEKFFTELSRVPGERLIEDAYLLLSIPEIQFLIINDGFFKGLLEKSKELKKKKIKITKKHIIEYLEDRQKITNKTIQIIKAYLLHWNAVVDINTMTRNEILAFLAVLFLDRLSEKEKPNLEALSGI